MTLLPPTLRPQGRGGGDSWVNVVPGDFWVNAVPGDSWVKAVKKAARCFALPVEATWNLLLIRGVAGAVFVETWPALSFPFVLFLLLPVVSVLRHSVDQ